MGGIISTVMEEANSGKREMNAKMGSTVTLALGDSTDKYLWNTFYVPDLLTVF